MGAGNVGVFSPVGGEYYIDFDDLYVYRAKDDEDDVRLMRDVPFSEIEDFEFSEFDTELEIDDVIAEFRESMIRRFPSFKETDLWLLDGPYSRSRSRHAILENGLFWIATEDNQWSLAVELIPKEESWGEPWMVNLQGRHFQKYLDGIKEALFEQFEYVSYRSSAWTSGTLRRECAAS